MRVTPFSLKAYEAEIESLYKLVFDHELRECNCKDRLSDAIIEMSVYLKNNDKMRSEINYKLKNGIVLVWKNNPYTNANLTDEVAVAFLKEFPMRTDWFAKMPKASEVKVPKAKATRRATKKAEK